MDEECALMPTAAPREGMKWILHLSHPHPLFLVEKDQFRCFGCGHSSSGATSAYGCLTCDFFLEESCAELPMQIHHPLHAHHGVLSLRVQNWFNCDICKTIIASRDSLTFSCGKCHFGTCVKCAKDVMRRTRNIKYEDHDHPLCLVGNINSAELNSGCNGYDDYCAQVVVSRSKDFKSTKSYMLLCLECNFRVHLMCGPLPSVVKHQCHIHPLVLFDSLPDDDSIEYYCDVCETERDPWIRLYCCRECKYFAHVKCLISEIKKTLRGELKDVKLKTPGQDIWERHQLIIDEDTGQEKSVLIKLKDVIKELSKTDRLVLKRFYKWDETSSKDEKGIHEISKLKDEEINEILRLTRFTEMDFQSFYSNLNQIYLYNKLDLKSSDLELKIVNVRGYMIPHPLAKVLKTLFDEFGDISSDSRETVGMKSFIFFVVCKVLKGMHSTMANCITKTLLEEWFYHLTFARENDFKIDFVWAQLEQLVQAFIGFQVKRLEHEIPTELNKKIAELQQRLDKYKLQLDKCKKIQGSSPTSKFLNDCLNKASKLEWRDALGDLFKRKDNK